MENIKISERKVIIYTAGLVVFAGIVKLMAFVVGTVFFYLAFAPYIIYRIISVKNQKESDKNSLSHYRLIVLVVMVISIVLNIIGWQEADFFLLFLLMIDYLLVINKKF